MTDPRGVAHEYFYNNDGQQTQDNVTSFGTSGDVSETVNQIDTCYDDIGRVHTVTIKGVVGEYEAILNQIQYAYDGWGNEVQEWQALTGSVDTESTPSVQYEYDDGAVEGVAQFVRLSAMIYPNGREVDYGYGETTGTPTFAQTVDKIMSRLATISDSSGTLATYTWLGVGAIASQSDNQPEIDLDYSGDNFAALDRFGNILNQVWSSYGSESGGSLESPVTLDGYTYSYDRGQNRTSRENLTDAALSELYGYNALDELTSMSRGTISDGTIASPSASETWTLDSLGNFVASTDGGSTQDRTDDAANEIQSISGGAATPAYDAAGNMTSTPEPGSEGTGLTCVYDAWDRLTEVSNSTSVLAEYQYDGTGREIVEFTSFTGSTAGTVTYSYHSGQNAIETRTGSASSSPTSLGVQYQYVFSAMGVKTALVRDTYAEGEIVPADRLYYLTDANTNVTAVVGLSDSTWVVSERYLYDPYGAVTVYSPDWSTVVGSSLTASTVGNTIGFASMSFDAVTGLYYDEARWYSTATSGFITTDP